MPTDHQPPTSQIDQDGFPISIGFRQGETRESAQGNPSADDETLALGENESHDSELLNDEEDTSSEEPLTGYELVEEMMRRQDEVLVQLDDLNDRIEAAIQEVTTARKSEIEAQEADANDQAMDQRRAA